MHILVLHQDQELMKDMKYSFEADGDTVTLSHSIEGARKKIEKEDFDIWLLGGHFSDGTVLDFMRDTPNEAQTPTIVLSKNTETKNIILSLEYGCDDYMAYPIDLLELKARIRAIKRRVQAVQEVKKKVEEADITDFTLDRGDIVICLARQEVQVNGVPVNLTHKEFNLMVYFVQNEGKVLSRGDIAKSIWGDEIPDNIRTVDVYIRRLRAKLEKHGVDHKLQTKWGKGYIFNRNFIKE